MTRKNCHKYLDCDIIDEEKPLLLDLFNDITNYSEDNYNCDVVVKNLIYKFNKIIKKYYDKEDNNAVIVFLMKKIDFFQNYLN